LRRVRTHFALLLLGISALTGCRQLQLRTNTARQARTIADMHTQQVLDNLAMFVYAPGSFPSFSTFKQGSSQITDKGSLAVPTGFGRFSTLNVFGITSLAVQPSLARDAFESWIIEPVNNPRKLELMRCAYQRAVAGRHLECTGCPDCQKRFNSFYTGNANGDIGQAVTSGITTSNCLSSDSCWFHVGCHKCAPKACDCAYVGSYCGVYVWVDPQGRDELSKLTLAILDYAVNEPARVPQRTKRVVVKRNKNGEVESTEVTADIDLSDSVQSFIDLDASARAAARLELQDLLNRRGVSIEQLVQQGPLELERLSPEEKIRIVELLAALGNQPAQEIVEKAEFDSQAVGQLLSAPPPETGGIDSLNDSIKSQIAPSELSAPPLTPLVIPSAPTPSQASGTLELRQELNAVTPSTSP
jgi:hypothetical protein